MSTPNGTRPGVDPYLTSPDYVDEFFENGTVGATVATTNTSFNSTAMPNGSLTFMTPGYTGLGANSSAAPLNWGSAAATAGWNVPTAAGQAYSQHALFSSYPYRTVMICQMQTAAGAQVADLEMRSDGRLQIINNANAVLVVSYNPVPLNQWVKIRFTVYPDPSAGTAKIEIFYSPAAAIADDSSSVAFVAIPGGLSGKAWFGLDTRFAVTWNAEALTNLGASVPIASSLAALQANGFVYSDTNFGHNQTIPNPATYTFTSTHTKSVNWGVELHTIPYSYAASPSVNIINAYNQFAENPNAQVAGTHSGAAATSHVISVPTATWAGNALFVAFTFGVAGITGTVADSAGNVFTQVGSQALNGSPGVNLYVYQATAPVKAIAANGTVTITPSASAPCNAIAFWGYSCGTGVLMNGSAGNSASIATATGTLPTNSSGIFAIQYNQTLVNTFSAPVSNTGNISGSGAGFISVGFQGEFGTGTVTVTSTTSAADNWARILIASPATVNTGHLGISQAVTSQYIWLLLAISGSAGGSPTVTDSHGNTFTQVAFYALSSGQRVFLFQSSAAVTYAASGDWYSVATSYSINGWAEMFAVSGVLTAVAPSFTADNTGTSATPTISNATVGTGNNAVLWIAGNNTEAEVVPSGFTHLNPGTGSGGTGGYAGTYAALGIAYYADRTGTLVISPDWVYDDFNASIVYTGNWGNTQNGQNLTPPATWYGGTQHFSNITGNYATLNFNMPMSGSLYIQFSVDTNRGIGSVSIDGGTAVLVDTYSSTLHNNFMVWKSPILSKGSHTVVITVTGTKNANATGYYVGIDVLSNMPIVSGYGTIPAGDSSIVNVVSTNVATSGSFSVTDTQGNAYTLLMSNTAPGNVVSQFVFVCLSPKALGASDTISVTCTTYFEGYASAYGIQGVNSLIATAPGGSVTASSVDMKVTVSSQWAPVLLSATVAVIGSVPSPNGLWTAIDNLTMSGTLAGTISQNLSFNVMSNGQPTSWSYLLDNCTVKQYAKIPAPPDQSVWVDILNTSFVSQGMVQYATVTATLYYNAVGSWTILVPYSEWLWKQITSGDFIVRVNWRNLFEFGGKCEQPAYVDSLPGSMGASAGTSGNYSGPFITLNGGDYLQILANRICYPDPTKAWSGQLPGDADVVVNTPLETAIKHYVSVNAGSGAISGRSHPLLDVATDQARGPNVNYSVKFGSGVDLGLLDVLRAMISQAYPNSPSPNMGFRITRNGQRLLFDVYTPVDKSQTAYFSEELGNLTSVNLSLTDPTCTDALVQGSTPTTSGSVFYQLSGNNITPWNKTEVFVDGTNETDTNNIHTLASNQLFSGTWGPTLGNTVSDTPFCVYGRDYILGDIVTIEVRPGITYTDVVTSVTLTADASQTPTLNVVPTIGNSTDSTSADKSVINQLTSRIRNIEKKLRRVT